MASFRIWVSSILNNEPKYKFETSSDGKFISNHQDDFYELCIVYYDRALEIGDQETMKTTNQLILHAYDYFHSSLISKLENCEIIHLEWLIAQINDSYFLKQKWKLKLQTTNCYDLEKQIFIYLDHVSTKFKTRIYQILEQSGFQTDISDYLCDDLSF